MKRLKVIHIITRMILGGAQENTILSVEGLLRQPDRYETLLVSGPPLGEEGELLWRVRKSGIPFILIPELRRDINPVLDLISFARLYLLLLHTRPHIVHTHSSKAGILGRWAAWLAGVPIIIHTIHGLPFHPYQPKWVYWLYMVAERLTAFMTDKIITVGEVMKQKALAARLGPEHKFQVIYSGIEVDNFIPEAQQSLHFRRLYMLEDSIVLGMISRLAPLKGHKYLLEAFKILKRNYPKLRMVLVGDGKLREGLKAEVQGAGLKQDVIFAGIVGQDQIANVIGAMDIVVHTSLREGLPRSIPQAFLCKKPVVCFDIDGAREVVKDGVTGYLVRPGSVEGLVEAISRIIDRRQAKQMGQKGYELFADQFRADRMVKDIAKLYEQLYNR